MYMSFSMASTQWWPKNATECQFGRNLATERKVDKLRQTCATFIKKFMEEIRHGHFLQTFVQMIGWRPVKCTVETKTSIAGVIRRIRKDWCILNKLDGHGKKSAGKIVMGGGTPPRLRKPSAAKMLPSLVIIFRSYELYRHVRANLLPQTETSM